VVDDGTHASLKGALERDNSKRADLKENLAALPAASQKDGGYAELAHNLPVDVSDGERKDALGNELPPNPPTKRKATKSDLKKIRKRIEAQRLEGQTVNTDEELDRYGFYRAVDEPKPAAPKPAPVERGESVLFSETATSVVKVAGDVIGGVGTAASAVYNATANVVETVVSPKSARRAETKQPTGEGGAAMNVAEPTTGDGDAKEKENCAVM